MRILQKRPLAVFPILLVLSVVLLPAPAAAADGVVKVYESTFNELANAIEPIHVSGRYRLEVCFIWCVTICDATWTADVTQLSFDITPALVSISGRVDARWCGANFTAQFATNANVSYSASQNAILVTVNPTNIQPHVNVLGFDVALPVHINVASALTLPPIPMGIAYFHFETARGPRTLHLRPYNIILTKRNGYVELQADVNLL